MVFHDDHQYQFLETITHQRKLHSNKMILSKPWKMSQMKIFLSHKIPKNAPCQKLSFSKDSTWFQKKTRNWLLSSTYIWTVFLILPQSALLVFSWGVRSFFGAKGEDHQKSYHHHRPHDNSHLRIMMASK